MRGAAWFALATLASVTALLLFVAPKSSPTKSRQLLERLSFRMCADSTRCRDGFGADGAVVQSLQTAALNFPASNPAAALAALSALVVPIFTATPSTSVESPLLPISKAVVPAHLLPQLAIDPGASVTWPPHAVGFSLGDLAPATRAPSRAPASAPPTPALPPAPTKALSSAATLASTILVAASATRHVTAAAATAAAATPKTGGLQTEPPASRMGEIRTVPVRGFDSSLQLKVLQELGQRGPRLFKQGEPDPITHSTSMHIPASPAFTRAHTGPLRPLTARTHGHSA